MGKWGLGIGIKNEVLSSMAGLGENVYPILVLFLFNWIEAKNKMNELHIIFKKIITIRLINF